MLEPFIAATPASEAAESSNNLWTFLGGPMVGAAVATGVLVLINTFVTKKVPDVQTQTQALLGGLENMVTLMTEDKAKDAARITALQVRVDELENESVRDLEQVNRLYVEIRTLESELARKDATIRLLVDELRALGTIAHGLEENLTTTITFERNRNNE